MLLTRSAVCKVIHRLSPTIKTGVFQVIRMDGRFALPICIIGHTASTLVSKIVNIRRPLVCVRLRIIELTLGKHCDISMEHAIERDIDISRLIEVWYRFGAVWILTSDLSLTITECVGSFGCIRNNLHSWITDCGIPWIRRAVVAGNHDTCSQRDNRQT